MQEAVRAHGGEQSNSFIPIKLRQCDLQATRTVNACGICRETCARSRDVHSNTVDHSENTCIQSGVNSMQVTPVATRSAQVAPDSNTRVTTVATFAFSNVQAIVYNIMNGSAFLIERVLSDS